MDRASILCGHYVFWSLNHAGQFSKGYETLCRIGHLFKPGPLWSESRVLEDEDYWPEARDVYRALCRKHKVSAF
jgi:hypothetical protein